MENFKKHVPSKGIVEREYYVSLVLSSEALKQRWKLINYTPPIQLTLF